MALELILQLYESLFDPEQRHALLGRVLEYTGGTGCNWFSADDKVFDDNFIAFIGEDFDAEHYINHVFAIDGWHKMTQRFAPGDTMHLSEEFNRQAFGKTEFFNEFHLPCIKAASICTAIVDPKTSSHFSIYRGPGDDPFPEEIIRLWDTLNPHLQNWARLYSKIGKIEHGARLLSDTLDRLSMGVVVIDERMRISEMNAKAREIFKKNRALSVVQGIIHCHIQNDTNLLHALVLAASRTSQGRNMHPGGALRVASGDNRPLDIAISPLRRGSKTGLTRGQALMLISDPGSQRNTKAEALRAIYGMTPAEAEVADLLLHGKSVSEISEIRGATVATIRTQIKTILSKAGVKKQSEFVKSVAWLDAVSSEASEGVS